MGVRGPVWSPGPPGEPGMVFESRRWSPGEASWAVERYALVPSQGPRTWEVRPGLCPSHPPGDLLSVYTSLSKSFPSLPPPSLCLHHATSLISAQIATILLQDGIPKPGEGT